MAHIHQIIRLGSPPYRVKLGSWLPRLVGHDCITIRRTIYARHLRISAHLHAHEHKHVLQWYELGVVRFVFAYLREQLLHGYAANRFEQEAHAHALVHEADYDQVIR